MSNVHQLSCSDLEKKGHIVLIRMPPVVSTTLRYSDWSDNVKLKATSYCRHCISESFNFKIYTLLYYAWTYFKD